MEIREIIQRINAVLISENATITQLKHEEDDEFYQVWRIHSNGKNYLLKQAKGDEKEIYPALLSDCKDSVPALYQTITADENTYLLLEYIDGENVCKCNREKLILTLNALISLQEKTWETLDFKGIEHLFTKSVAHRENRGKYLRDELLESAYAEFLRVYQAAPRTLCHDDLLPFNVLCTDKKAVLIDWEVGGILPYPTSFARLIAHTEEDEDALFYMSQADKDFAVDYYYEKLLKNKGISYLEWKKTLEYFLFYEYCEWVFVGHKYNATDGEYYQKYLPLAQKQARKILEMQEK